MGQSQRYKTKSCGIEAIQYDGLNHKEIEKFLGIPVAFDSGFAERLSISRKAMRLLECIKDGYKYVARNSTGVIFLYIDKPEKDSRIWFSNMPCLSIKRFDVDFPMIKWEDKEPWKIDDLKKLEVIDSYI